MAGTSEGAKKAAETLRKKNPNHFRELAQKVRTRGRRTGHSALFEAGSDRTRMAGSQGGKARAATYRKEEDRAEGSSDPQVAPLPDAAHDEARADQDQQGSQDHARDGR